MTGIAFEVAEKLPYAVHGSVGALRDSRWLPVGTCLEAANVPELGGIAGLTDVVCHRHPLVHLWTVQVLRFPMGSIFGPSR